MTPVRIAARAGDPPEAPREKIVRLHGSAFVADPAGVLYWPDEHLLVVADLHLEKGSSYAARRVFLPPYDSGATLARLAAAVGRFDPKRVVALGDSFHDGAGAARLGAADHQTLRAMQVGRDWLWIAGNHDPSLPDHGERLGGDHAGHLAVGRIRFRHIPSVSPCDGEIAGHLHPIALVAGKGGAVRRRCFVADAMRCIMPAFGAYAGGLNFLDPGCGGLFAGGDHHAHVLGRDAVYTVARRQCLMERTGFEVRWR